MTGRSRRRLLRQRRKALLLDRNPARSRKPSTAAAARAAPGWTRSAGLWKQPAVNGPGLWKQPAMNGPELWKQPAMNGPELWKQPAVNGPGLWKQPAVNGPELWKQPAMNGPERLPNRSLLGRGSAGHD